MYTMSIPERRLNMKLLKEEAASSLSDGTSEQNIQCTFFVLRFILKGTVSIISSNPPCKDGNSRYTTVPFKPLSQQ